MSFLDHTIDLPWRNFVSPEFGAKFQRDAPLFLEVLKFPYNADYGSHEAVMPKTSFLRLVVSIQYRLVTDGQTDGRTHDDGIHVYRAIA